jgi:5-methylcytosine-specific restriction endonuclease McrA
VSTYTRILPQTFTCEGCYEVIARRQNDRRRQFCSRKCKLKAWWRTHPAYEINLTCQECATTFVGTHKVKYCSPTCRNQAIEKLRKPKQTVTLTCVQCGTVFIREKGSNPATCSSICRGARLSTQLQGKKYRPAKVYERECSQCGQMFIGRMRPSTCSACSRRSKHWHGKFRDRCRHAGVPYTPGVTPLKVFLRDGYRCQLCGCATPKRLRGTYKPNAPELDHIVPIAAGGGHTWDNVQCACRSCNHQKRDKPLGQMRLAV